MIKTRRRVAADHPPGRGKLLRQQLLQEAQWTRTAPKVQEKRRTTVAPSRSPNTSKNSKSTRRRKGSRRTSRMLESQYPESPPCRNRPAKPAKSLMNPNHPPSAGTTCRPPCVPQLSQGATQAGSEIVITRTSMPSSPVPTPVIPPATEESRVARIINNSWGSTASRYRVRM